MEFIILMAIIIAYISLSEKIEHINNTVTLEKKKKIPALNTLLDKQIKIIVDDLEAKGKLIDFDATWIILENKNKKKEKKLYYYRIKKIMSIDIEEEM